MWFRNNKIQGLMRLYLKTFPISFFLFQLEKRILKLLHFFSCFKEESDYQHWLWLTFAWCCPWYWNIFICPDTINRSRILLLQNKIGKIKRNNSSFTPFPNLAYVDDVSRFLIKMSTRKIECSPLWLTTTDLDFDNRFYYVKIKIETPFIECWPKRS